MQHATGDADSRSDRIGAGGVFHPLATLTASLVRRENSLDSLMTTAPKSLSPSRESKGHNQEKRWTRLQLLRKLFDDDLQLPPFKVVPLTRGRPCVVPSEQEQQACDGIIESGRAMVA